MNPFNNLIKDNLPAFESMNSDQILQELIQNEEKLERCVRILNDTGSLTEVRVYGEKPPVWVFNCADTICEVAGLCASRDAYKGVREKDCDLSKKYTEEYKSASLKGWHEMAEEFSYSVRLEKLRKQVYEDRAKKGTDSKGAHTDPMFSAARWAQVKAQCENNMMILNLQELTQDPD